jgi:hypothetical protein
MDKDVEIFFIVRDAMDRAKSTKRLKLDSDFSSDFTRRKQAFTNYELLALLVFIAIEHFLTLCNMFP